MHYSSAMSGAVSSAKPDASVWQEIISTDAKFNLYRINNNSQLSKNLPQHGRYFANFRRFSTLLKPSRDALHASPHPASSRERHEVPRRAGSSESAPSLLEPAHTDPRKQVRRHGQPKHAQPVQPGRPPRLQSRLKSAQRRLTVRTGT